MELSEVKEWVMNNQVDVMTKYFREEKELKMMFSRYILTFKENELTVTEFSGDSQMKIARNLDNMSAKDLVSYLLNQFK